MKRNMDLVRDILLIVESTPANQHVGNIEPENYSDAEVLEHLEMLIDAKFLDGKVVRSGAGDERIYHVHVSALTWQGREFIDSVRNDALWQKTKSTIVEKGGSYTLDILKALANAYLKAHLGLPL